MKKIKEVKTFDERKEELLALGKKEGFITFEQLADALKGLDIDSDALDELYNLFIENGITVVSNEDNASSGESKTIKEEEVELLTDEDLTKDININDPVRMYLKEIGRISLLSPEEEADLSIRVANGDEEAKRILAEKKLEKTVTGKIISITSNGEIFVDINYKADGIIPKKEYSNDENADGDGPGA